MTTVLNNYAMSHLQHNKHTLNKSSPATLKTLVNNNNVAKGQQDDYLVIRKKQRVTIPLTESTSGNIMASSAVTTFSSSNQMLQQKKPSIVSSSVKAAPSQMGIPPAVVAASTSKKGAPLPVAVARRNARERNRVKQVNNGFAALRERIPEELAESFEAAASTSSGRCPTTSATTTKKLSKVETLRMAVEYIRNLEMILANDGHQFVSQTQSSTTLAQSPSSSSMEAPSPAEQDLDCSNLGSGGGGGSYEDESLMMDQTIAEITIIDGHQYVRLPGTNTFQLLSSFYATDDENVAPSMNESIILQPSQTNYAITSSGYVVEQQQNIIAAAAAAATLPPASSPASDGFSGHSISPVLLETTTTKTEPCYIIDDSVKDEQHLHSPTASDEGAAGTLFLNSNNRYEGVITMKQEMISADDALLEQIDEQQISAESMMEAIDWWDKTNLDGQDVV